MSTSNERIRQYLGLGLVGLAYIAGIIGWTWAALSL